MTKTLEEAGVLQVGGNELTDGAKYKFIEDIRQALKNGSNWDPPIFKPCGPEVAPLPTNVEPPNLHDEKLFPDFHNVQVKKYLELAKVLNFEGMEPFVPFVFDPMAIGSKLGINIPQMSLPEISALLFNLPALLIKLELTPLDLPKFLSKLSALGIPPNPFPPSFPLPSITLPQVSVGIPTELLPDLLEVFLSLAKIPLEIPKLLSPTAILPILSLQLSTLCTSLLKILPATSSTSSIEIALYKVLAIKLTECVAIDAVGLTLGSSSGGAVGALGKEFGYTPPPLKNDGSNISLRDKIINFAKSCDGLSYSEDKKKYATALFPDMLYKNDSSKGDLGTQLDVDENGINGNAGEPKQKAINFASTASSCGIFARSCLIMAGASGDKFFENDYVPGTAISGLLDIARKRNALLFDRIHNDKKIVSCKRGDIIVVGDSSGKYPFHVEILLDDFNADQNSVEGIGGGSADLKNFNPNSGYYYTKISSTTYKFETKSKDGYYELTFAGPQNDDASLESLRPLLAIIDSEKIIQNI